MKRLELVTDVAVIKQNAIEIKQRIPDPNARLLCVVKADAYGHGAVKTAQALSGIADAFAVATPLEGAELRESGVRQPIVVLGLISDYEDAALSVKYELCQAVDDARDVCALDEAALKQGTRAKLHIKIDTGMSRIGVRDFPALSALLDEIKTLKNVTVDGMFTHFCAADEDEAFTREQKSRFDRAIEAVRQAGFDPICHAAASTAMLKKGYSYGMVRAGIALYGTGVKELSGIVRPAQTLLSHPVAIRRVLKGETVGYGRTFTAQRDSLIATVPCGYGDGYPRILSGRADVLIHGCRAPLTGRVCMDMLMADVTDIPGAGRESEVVLLGKQGNEAITPDELAEKAGTIPYEIMLGFSQRVYKSWKNTEV